MASVNLRDGACFKTTCISVYTCFSVGLFFVAPCKADSKHKNNKYVNNHFSKSGNSAGNYLLKLYSRTLKQDVKFVQC